MPVVVYYGDESYLLEQAATRLRQETIDPAMASLCHRVFSQPSLGTVLEAVGSVSLALGGKTLVEIRDFSLLAESAKDTATEKQLEELKGLLEGVEETKTILFLNNKVDGKIKFAKWITKHPKFATQKFERFKFWEGDKAADFLLGYANHKGIQIAPDAVELLVSAYGPEDLRLLTSEMDKLELYALDRKITRDHVGRMINHSDNLFLVVDRWILGLNARQNYLDLHEIFLKRHAVEVFATIQSYFNNIFRVMWLNSQGSTIDTIAQRTGQKPFTIKKHLGNFRQVPMERWLKLKHLLTDMEWKAKTGKLEGHLALETMLGA